MSRVGDVWSRVVPLVALGLLAVRLGADDAATDGPPGEAAASAPKVPVGKSEYARKIAVRNAFALQDPVPPAPVTPPPPPPPPPPPKSNVQLTGFSVWGGERSVYLVVSRADSKAPRYYTLKEGDEQADIKVLRIDERNETAVILNTGMEETLNFKDNGVKASPTATSSPNAPGAVIPGGMAPGAPSPVVNRLPGGVPAPGSTGGGPAGPTVVGRGGVVDVPQAALPAAPVAAPAIPLNTVPHPQGDGSVTLPVVGGGGVPVTGRRIFNNIPPPPLPPGN